MDRVVFLCAAPQAQGLGRDSIRRASRAGMCRQAYFFFAPCGSGKVGGKKKNMRTRVSCMCALQTPPGLPQILHSLGVHTNSYHSREGHADGLGRLPSPMRGCLRTAGDIVKKIISNGKLRTKQPPLACLPAWFACLFACLSACWLALPACLLAAPVVDSTEMLFASDAWSRW